MMMNGQATGKGLNVKGKSAKKGVLSGYVPFLQIAEEAHKAKVTTCPADATIRVYYTSVGARAAAAKALEPVLADLLRRATAAQAGLVAEAESGEELPRDDHLKLVTDLTTCFIALPVLTPLDGCEGAWGLEMPERLMWEAYVLRQDISHPKGWETGRGSEPDYMDMNLHSTRKVMRRSPNWRACRSSALL